MEEELHKQSRYVYHAVIVCYLHTHLPRNSGHQSVDSRTQGNHIELHNEGFKCQFTGIVDTYIAWQVEIREEGLSTGHPLVAKESLQGTYKVQVLNIPPIC